MDKDESKKNLNRTKLFATAAASFLHGDHRRDKNHRGTPARYRAYHCDKRGHRVVVNRETGEIVG